LSGGGGVVVVVPDLAKIKFLPPPFPFKPLTKVQAPGTLEGVH